MGGRRCYERIYCVGVRMVCSSSLLKSAVFPNVMRVPLRVHGRCHPPRQPPDFLEPAKASTCASAVDSGEYPPLYCSTMSIS
jgi:hypothetical protein